MYDITGVTGITTVWRNGGEWSGHFTKNAFGDVAGLFGERMGNLVARYEYDAWGNHRIVSGSNEVIYDSVTGEVKVGFEEDATVLNPWRWRGLYYDQETGLYAVPIGGMTRYYDPRLGVVLNATLDEAFMEGGYAHGVTNPFEVFGNTFSAPTWGYPEPYICECPPNEGCNYCDIPWRRPRLQWWHWVFGPWPLTVLHATGVISPYNRNAWRVTNALTAGGIVIGGVTLGALTGGLLLKPFKIGIAVSIPKGLKAGGIAGGINWTATGLRTDGFADMTGSHARSLFESSFGAGLGGAFSAGAGHLIKGKGWSPAVTTLATIGANAAINTSIYTVTSMATQSFSGLGLGIAVKGGILPVELKILLEIIKAGIK